MRAHLGNYEQLDERLRENSKPRTPNLGGHSP
jgi:hypothetical protein